MLNFSLFVVLCLISNVFGDQRLLIDQLRWDFLEMENDLWNLSANGLLEKKLGDAELYLVKHFYDFDQKLKQMPDDLNDLDSLRALPDYVFLYSEMKIIQNKYEKFLEYQYGQIHNPKKKLMIDDVIYDILNNKTGVKTSDEYIHVLAFSQEGSIEEQLIEMTSGNFWCRNVQQSPQQLFYSLYNVVSLNELKAYAMHQFAYLSNRLRDKGDNVELSIQARKNYEKRMKQPPTTRDIFKRAMKDIWRCDPKIHIKGQTFDEFTRLLQGHIQNEVDMSPTRTCTATCSDYSYTKSYGCYDYETEFCRKVEKCQGNLINCRFVEQHPTICVASNSPRRYNYVRYESGYILGKQQDCASKNSVSSWRRLFVKCDYCMCLCDEHGPRSDRYINLRPVMADIKNNRVVTGLRLIKKNRMLHLQIQEGKLLPRGHINDSTVHWVPVDNYKITDKGVKNGDDFYTMTYPDRSMALDDIQVHEDNYVVTGVRFEVIQKKVHFEIHVNSFDWNKGAVLQNNGYYIYESNPDGRSKISLPDADVPILTNKSSEIYTSHASLYVEFTRTSFEKDAAQTTIPYIDTQEVICKPPVPLIGAGIYYKGAPGYGGFIAPRIKTYDFGKHMSNAVPKMKERIDI